MLASVLQSCCELSGPKLGPGHDGRRGAVEEQSADVCGHGVYDDPAVSVPGSEVSDAGGEVQPAS